MGPELVSMAQQFEGLPMEALIGGPLNAAAQANAAMALTQTQFMLDTCFGYDDTTPGKRIYNPVMLEMTLTRTLIVPNDDPTIGPDLKSFDTTFKLPMLTIIPLNSLAVETVDVNFSMEVSSSYSEEQSKTTEENTSAEATIEAKLGWGFLSVTVTGSASYEQKDSSSFNTHYQKSNSAKYTVAVHAGQLPLPVGVNIILQQYANAIQPLTVAPVTS